jgi:uncharacterized membrane protein (DUF373 family)
MAAEAQQRNRARNPDKISSDERCRATGVPVGDLKRLSFLFDLWVLRILRATLGVGIIAALAILVWLVIREMRRAVEQIETIAQLQDAVQSLFAGILLVVLGLELMDTLRNYFIEHRLRVELLISVALIAVARHIIQLDYEHTPPWLVAAIALLVFSLAAGYVGIRVLIHGGSASNPDRSASNPDRS